MASAIEKGLVSVTHLDYIPPSWLMALGDRGGRHQSSFSSLSPVTASGRDDADACPRIWTRIATRARMRIPFRITPRCSGVYCHYAAEPARPIDTVRTFCSNAVRASRYAIPTLGTSAPAEQKVNES